MKALFEKGRYMKRVRMMHLIAKRVERMGCES